MDSLVQWADNHLQVKQSIEICNAVAVVPLMYIAGVGIDERMPWVMLVSGVGLVAWLWWMEIYLSRKKKRTGHGWGIVDKTIHPDPRPIGESPPIDGLLFKASNKRESS